MLYFIGERPAKMDKEKLATILEKLLGKKRVLANDVGLICYSQDFFPANRLIPDLVVKPDSPTQIIEILKLAGKELIPITPRGSGTSVTGGPLPVQGGIILDLSGMDRIISVDQKSCRVTVEPGVVWNDLNTVLRKDGLFFPSTPGSARVSTVGGSVATGGSGMRSLKYGTVRTNALKLRVILPDGTPLRLGSKTIKDSCGYDLKDLFIGSEGTLGVIFEVTLRIYPLPRATVLLEAELPDLSLLDKIAPAIFTSGLIPSAMEISDRSALLYADKESVGIEGTILVELDGNEVSVKDETRKIKQILKGLKVPRVTVTFDQKRQKEIWKQRSELYFKLIRETATPVAEDLGVPVSEFSTILRSIRGISQKSGVEIAALGHISDETIHLAILSDLRKKGGQSKVARVREKIYQAVLKAEGTITSEHGLGIYRAPFAYQQLGDALEVMKSIKRSLDPHGIMNPGKMGLDLGRETS